MSVAENTVQKEHDTQNVQQTNEALFRRLIEEGFNQGNLAVVDELAAPDFKEHQFFGPNHPQGPAGLKAVITECRRLFPDFHMTIEDISTTGDTVWFRLRSGGTHGGELLGRPATGRHVEIDVIDICRFRNGKISEHWGVPDRFHMLMQIGLLPQPPARPQP